MALGLTSPRNEMKDYELAATAGSTTHVAGPAESRLRWISSTTEKTTRRLTL